MMLTDHIASSIILSNSIRTIRDRKILWILCIISSIVPDILAFFYHPGSIEYLYHRRFTNSVILAPLYVLVITIIFKIITYKNHLPFFIIFVVSLLSYFLHIILDLITPYGSPLFFPLTNKLYSFDLIHSFDPVFLTLSIALIVIFVVSIIKQTNWFQHIARPVLYVYLVYISMMFVYKNIASLNYKNYLSSNFPNAHYEATIPKTFWRWRGIATENNKVIQLNGMLSVKKIVEFNSIDKLSEFIKSDGYFRKFVSYARFPVSEIQKNQISVFNAIYSSESYKLTYKFEGDSIVYKTISGFDLIDK